MSKKGKIVTCILLLIISMQTCSSQNIYTNGILAELVLKTNGGGVRPDYGLFIAEYLRDIGIDVHVKVEEWIVFIGCLLQTHDYDMGIVGLSGGGATPDMYDIYGVDGSLNLFGITKEIPYGNVSENMMIEGSTIMDLETRQQHYYDWQNLMMDKIVPMLPLFAPQSYVGTWSNLRGYDANWGLINSLPRMSYKGLHEGQESIDEFRFADANWRDLNPLLTDCGPEGGYIWNTLNERIILFSSDLAPVKTGLVRDWEQINDFHFKFYMRDNVLWNPSYNITGRDENSIPLNEIPESQLMKGLKDNEYSDGANQKVTAKDAVFTLLLWCNSITSESSSYHSWIQNIYVDPENPLAFHIHIDKNPKTPEIEYYPDFWQRLNWIIYPEFFLNSSDPTVSYSSGGVQCTGFYSGILDTDPWIYFSTSAFGCGKYMLDYFIKNEKTVLRASPFWMGVDPVDGTHQELDIKTINVRVIPDISAELAEFKAGKLDWTGLRAFPSIRKQMQADPRFDVQSTLTASFTFLFFNLQRPFLGGAYNYEYLTAPDKEEYTKGMAVRKAICYAVDREEINEIIHNGEYIIAHSVIYPYTGYFYYDDIIKYNYDLDVAKDWISSGGYTCTTTTNIALSPIIIFAFVIFSLTLRKRVKKRKNKDSA
jgi:ABC-type transport system substrate-binding protein